MANVKHIKIDGTSYDVVPSGSYVTGVKGSNESTYRTGNVNLSKTNVGLGNVPNVTTNNQTPTFSQASTRNNLVSGEKLSVLFGKIMKWFADLKAVAFSGSYTDLSNKPTIPTVNNATLTIQKNGTTVKTFTANASSNVTANITVPTKTSQLTNDSMFTTVSELEEWNVGYKAIKTWQASQMANVSAGSIVAINRNGTCTIKFVGVTCTPNTALVDASTVIGYDYMYDDNATGIYVDNGRIFSKNANVGNRILTFANTIG